MNPQQRATPAADDPGPAPGQRPTPAGADGAVAGCGSAANAAAAPVPAPVGGSVPTDGSALTGGSAAGGDPAQAPLASAPLNRPARWAFAAIEVVAAVGLVLVAMWAWDRASVPVRLPDYENPAIPDFVSRQSGPWTAAAVCAALLAGLLVLDALRQTVLATRARSRPTDNTPADPDPPDPASDGPPDRDKPAYRATDGETGDKSS